MLCRDRGHPRCCSVGVMKQARAQVVEQLSEHTRDRMSSTKAAVTMACPYSRSRARASVSILIAMPTEVGARDTPAAIPSGYAGKPKATMMPIPPRSGRKVPPTATIVALNPTWCTANSQCSLSSTLQRTFRSIMKSTCSPDSVIIRVTPIRPSNFRLSTDESLRISITSGPKMMPQMISPTTGESLIALHAIPEAQTAIMKIVISSTCLNSSAEPPIANRSRTRAKPC